MARLFFESNYIQYKIRLMTRISIKNFIFIVKGAFEWIRTGILILISFFWRIYFSSFFYRMFLLLSYFLEKIFYEIIQVLAFYTSFNIHARRKFASLLTLRDLLSLFPIFRVWCNIYWISQNAHFYFCKIILTFLRKKYLILKFISSLK